MFSPQYSSSSGSDNSYTAVAPHVRKLRGCVSQGENTSPHEISLPQCIKDLVIDVNDLQERCARLELENAELKSTMHDLEGSTKNHGSKMSTSLINYSDSEESSDGTETLPHFLTIRRTDASLLTGGDTKYATKAEIAAMNNTMSQTRKDVVGILEQFDLQLTEIRAEGKSDVDNIRKNLTHVKGRIGVAEKHIKTIEIDMDDISLSKQDHDDDFFFKGPAQSSGDLQNYFTDELEKLQRQLKGDAISFQALQDRVQAQGTTIEAMQGDVHAQGVAVDDLVAAKRVNDAASKPEASNWNDAPSTSPARARTPAAVIPDPLLPVDAAYQIPFMKSDLNDMKTDIAALKTRSEVEQKIDNASKGDLVIMYRQLSKVTGMQDEQRRRARPFEGTPDELLPLCIRVVRRLALWDKFVDSKKGVEEKVNGLG